MRTITIYSAIKRYSLRLIIPSLLALFCDENPAAAQDTLKFRNGDSIIGNVLEITPTLIKYKRAENSQGPVYSELKNELASIKFKNGQTEVFEFHQPEVIPAPAKEVYLLNVQKRPPLQKLGTKFMYGSALIGSRDMYNIMLSLNDRRITDHIKLAKQQKAWQYIGFVAIPCGISALFFYDEANSGYRKSLDQDSLNNSAIMALLGVACISTSITLKVKRNRNEAAVLKLYQQNY